MRCCLPESSPRRPGRGRAHAGAFRGRRFAERRRSSRCTSWPRPRSRDVGVTSAGARADGDAARTSSRMRRTGAMTSSVHHRHANSISVFRLVSGRLYERHLNLKFFVSPYNGSNIKQYSNLFRGEL